MVNKMNKCECGDDFKSADKNTQFCSKCRNLTFQIAEPELNASNELVSNFDQDILDSMEQKIFKMVEKRFINGTSDHPTEPRGIMYAD